MSTVLPSSSHWLGSIDEGGSHVATDGIDGTTTRRVVPHRARTGNQNVSVKGQPGASVVLNFVYIEGREAL